MQHAIEPIRIEIENNIPDSRMEKWTIEARGRLGIDLKAIGHVGVYKIAPYRPTDSLQVKVSEVFADPVLQKIRFQATEYNFSEGKPSFVIEVSYRPGVTDNPARAASEALSIAGVEADVASASLYFLFGDIQMDDATRIADSLLANNLIQKSEVWPYALFMGMPRFTGVSLPRVIFSHAPEITEVSLERDDAALEKLSVERCLALSLPELHHIRDHYRMLKRNPTDVELEIIAQSWSEHCKHKIFAAAIDYTGKDGAQTRIDSLYRTYVKKATVDVKQARGIDWLISVFSDNAGIVRFDDNIDLAIKAETHNSPSALDPYGGALTGILGVNRDILGAGMGARPIANTDVFCFAPPDMPDADEALRMPEGVAAPRRILEGVHKGVEDGGNKSGIPTVNGAFFFDRDYAGKPLVFVGTVGALPHLLPDGRPAAFKNIKTGDRVFMVGGAIGADGIHGATFSSLELNDNAPATAVQIGDPITQKRMADFLLEARDLGLYRSITDNGAGGLSSSVGEMAQVTGGAVVDLARCPVKYPGLSPWELMVSESQERMTLAVPPEQAEAFLALAQRRGVSATDIGAFDDTGSLTVLYGDKVVGVLNMDFLHHSLPQMTLKATWAPPVARASWSSAMPMKDRRQALPDNICDILRVLLSSPNITSKEKWVRAYDHEVQAATHVKPFIGVENDGASDGGVISLAPHGGTAENAVAIACGLAPRMSLFDAGLMAQMAVDEALRNVVASGGDPDMCCLLDNFCWPDPVLSAKTPDGDIKLGHLVRACQGLYDVCLAYGTPLVSGKDSMKNDFRGKNKQGDNIKISVLPTLMVTAMAKTRIGLFVGSDFKNSGDVIYVLGDDGVYGLAGSELAAQFLHVEDHHMPRIDLSANIRLYRHVHQALKQNILQSIHDVSEGGMLVAVAESMIAGRKGAALDVETDRQTLFHEGAGRFVVSVAPGDIADFENSFDSVCFKRIGVVIDLDHLSLPNEEKMALNDIVSCWKKGF